MEYILSQRRHQNVAMSSQNRIWIGFPIHRRKRNKRVTESQTLHVTSPTGHWPVLELTTDLYPVASLLCAVVYG